MVPLKCKRKQSRENKNFLVLQKKVWCTNTVQAKAAAINKLLPTMKNCCMEELHPKLLDKYNSKAIAVPLFLYVSTQTHSTLS